MQKHFVTDSIFMPITEVLSFGTMHFQKASIPMPLETHEGAFELLHLTSGIKTLYCNGKRYQMRGGDMLLLHPGEEHGNPDEVQNKSALRFIIFRDPATTRGFLNMSVNERHQLGRQLRRCRQVQPNRALLGVLDACFEAVQHTDLLFATRLRASLFLLLDTLVQEHIQMEDAAELPEDIARVLALINQQNGQWLTVDAMARTANLSVPYFQQKFKRTMGVPPAEYLVRSRIAQACQLLIETDLPMLDIAMQLGLSSSQHFSTLFKRYTGFTPQSFRNTHKNQDKSKTIEI